ncbi:dihydrofolate reductase [Hyphococcus sp.]|uniref:dihydrofolate reductase n=1 Tax=Hyphococcus sp. TaxID=2038636 RepID=UPI0035C69A1C
MVAAAQADVYRDLSDYPIALIVARSRNYTIGCSNELPWRQQDDLKRFKNTTLGKPVIIGRRTFESIGAPLTGRLSIVLTRNSEFAKNINSQGYQNVRAVTTIGDAVRTANAFLDNSSLEGAEKEVIVAGGQEIFEAFVSSCSKIYLTVVEAEVDGDATFPREDKFPLFSVQLIGQCAADENNEHNCTYYEYCEEKGVGRKIPSSAGMHEHRAKLSTTTAN